MESSAVTLNFKLRTHEEALPLSERLAAAFHAPDQFQVGIYELLLNAIEHGNLGLGFETKAELLRQGLWEKEIRRRMALPEYADRHVSVRLTCDSLMCKLTIADQGRGFPWQHYVRQLSGSRRPNGRGLLIAFSCAFDQIIFNETGNEVTCVAKTPANESCPE